MSAREDAVQAFVNGGWSKQIAREIVASVRAEALAERAAEVARLREESAADHRTWQHDLKSLREARAEVEVLRARVAELEAASKDDAVDPDAEWRRIEAERPEAAITHRCGIPLTRHLDCGHCPHEVCEGCERCPHTCQCGTPVSIPQQRSEAS
ncbi:hypothetical protein ACFWV1_13170 [Streptomyces sp. NPDC058700]|uniref:hypothetical protein n=1 Tax=Streptomyces sp. NPDC058700 TaxID=3346607 RepID=UPI003659FE8D